jgi:hypothetical protein
MKAFWLAAVLLLICLPLAATPITSGSWYTFTYTNIGSFGTEGGVGPTVAPPWTFDGPGTFTLTDVYASGDMFLVYDNGAVLGLSSTPTIGQYCSDPAACLADANFSHGEFVLGAGPHSITILTVLSPYGVGDAFFRFDGEVPEPLTAVLMGVGLLGLGCLRRRRA